MASGIEAELGHESVVQVLDVLGLGSRRNDDRGVLLRAAVALLDHGADFLVVLDDSYRVRTASRSFTRVVSPGGGDLAGRDFLDLLDAGSREKARAFLDRAGGPQLLVELNHLAADGTVRLANYSFCRFVQPDGRPGVVAVGREQEQALRLVEQVVRLNQKAEEAGVELERQAETDSLTGLGNRRWLFPRLDTLWTSAARRGDLVWVVMADVDHFKRVNDTFGHQAGDEVLKAFAGALRGAVRSGDLVARYGGEEFVLAGPCRDGQELLLVTDRCLEAVRSLCVEPLGPTLRLTASLGAALAEPGPGNPPWLALQAADRAVYRAKARGRDRREVEPRLVGRGAGPKSKLEEPRHNAGFRSDAS